MSQRVIVITGGLGDLGRATVEAALDKGWRVAVIDHARDQAAPEGVMALAGVDLTDAGQAEQAMQAVGDSLGRIDALLNIAGGFAWVPVAEAQGEWERLFRLNLATAVNASRAALPWLKQSADGRIVNVGANGAVKAGAGMGPYAAAKAGVHRFTEALAEELKPASVTVNAVLPSILDTARNRADMPDADPSTWVAPADLAAVMLFLASPQSRAVTGALVPVTGRV